MVAVYTEADCKIQKQYRLHSEKFR